MKITIKQFSVAFPKTKISLEDIECNIKDFLIIKGSNGIGKTTLLQSIAKLQSYQGSIEINPKLDQDDIVFVPQNPFMFRGNVYHNLTIGLTITKKETKRLDDLIKLFGLESILEQDASCCSSGEKKKISLIRAMLLEPRLLLLDEPNTSLDDESLIALFSYLNQYQKDIDNRIVMVLHSYDTNKKPFDQNIILDQFVR